MEIVKKTEQYEIVRKRSGRYGVRDAKRKWVNGEEKVKILLAEKLIKAPEPKPEVEEEPPGEEAAAEQPADEGQDAAEDAGDGDDTAGD